VALALKGGEVEVVVVRIVGHVFLVVVVVAAVLE
jgi:hypothetical protein